MKHEKYLYQAESMKTDIRTYIALGIYREAYFENEERQSVKDTKTEKIINQKNEEMLEAWDKIYYFEKAAGNEIYKAIADLDEKEKQFIKKANEFYERQTKEKILPYNFETHAKYVRNEIGRILKAKEELNLSQNNENTKKLTDYIEQRHINLGGLIAVYSLQPYIDYFTPEEQSYIYAGRMAKIGSEFAERAEKARKFLKMSAIFKKSQAQTEDMTRREKVKTSNLTINLAKDVIDFSENTENKKDTMYDKLQDKIDGVLAKRGWKEIKKHMKKQYLKAYPEAADEEIEIQTKQMYYEAKNYLLNEYYDSKLKEDKLREKLTYKYGEAFNEIEFEEYLSMQIPMYYERYISIRDNYDLWYSILITHDFEDVNS